MKIEKSRSSILFEWKNGFMIDLWENLSEIIFWKRFNWNTWQFINIEFENDIIMGGYEFRFVFLCCGIRIRIPHETKKSKKQWDKINRSMKRIHQSCYGWVNSKAYNNFRKNKRTDEIEILEVANKKAYQYKKKIFIQ